jgi:hypothetical protein
LWLFSEYGRTTLSGEELRETCENELELEDLHHLMWLYPEYTVGKLF